MVNKKIVGQPKAPKAKKVSAKQSSQSSMNPTRKIIDTLKKKYEFRLNKANQVHRGTDPTVHFGTKHPRDSKKSCGGV